MRVHCERASEEMKPNEMNWAWRDGTRASSLDAAHVGGTLAELNSERAESSQLLHGEWDTRAWRRQMREAERVRASF